MAGPFAAIPAVAGLGSKIITGLNIAGGLSLIPLGMGLTDGMYESAVKTGPQGLEGEYKIGPIRGALGLIDQRFTQEGLTAGRDRYVQRDIESTQPYYQRQEYGIRGPRLGESKSDYLLRTAGKLKDAIKKKSTEDALEQAGILRTFRDSDPAVIRERRLENEATANALRVQQFEMGRLLAGDRRAFEAQQETSRINLFKAMNDNDLAVANLDLRRQDQANDMEIYRQRLADTKELKQNALLAAVVDGIGLTARGLIS